MLQAAPHRGAESATAIVDGWALGVLHRSDRTDAWLAETDATGAAVTGVLDNLEELRGALSAPAANPAEIAIRAFRAWGDEAPARMRGAFAGCVVVNGVLRCFRDHLGLRPLFFGEGPAGLAVATKEVECFSVVYNHCSGHGGRVRRSVRSTQSEIPYE